MQSNYNISFFRKHYVKIINNIKNKNELFKYISEIIWENHLINDKNVIFQELQKREFKGSTGFENGIAIPHSVINGLKEPVLLFLKSNNINWDSLDGKPTNDIFVILIPNDLNQNDLHLKILSTLSVSLMNKKNIDILNELSSEDEIFNFIKNNILLNSDESTGNNLIDLNSNFVVAVCACTYGLSHTYMAENKLLNYAKENNLRIKIQTIGSRGNLNQITEEEFERASLVILALDKEVDLPKINNKNIVKIRTIDVIKNTNKIFEQNVNSKIIKNINHLFKVRMQQSWMQVASKLINYLQWIALVFALVIIFHSFNVIDQKTFNKINEIIQYGILAIPSIASYVLIKYFTKDEFSASTNAFILLSLNFYINLKGNILSFGLISSILSSLISILFYNLILKPMREKITFKKIRGSIEFFLKIIIIIGVSVFLYFMTNYIPKINAEIYTSIYTYSNNNWWFRILVSLIFIYLMLYDMGGPLNKLSIIISSLLFCDSAIIGIGKIWSIPLTAEVLGITTPGISLWFRMVMFKKTLNDQEIMFSKKAGISAYNGISEDSLWIYEVYKVKAYWANLFVSIIIASFIGVFNIRYYGGFNFILGSIVGISFDNLLNNNLFHVLPISFNLAFLMTTSIGILFCSIIYQLFFFKTTKTTKINNFK